MKSLRRVIMLLVIFLGATNYGVAQNHEVEPKGVYKEIDVARHNKAIEILNGADEKAKQQMVNDILKNPNYYNPPVLYALSRQLFNIGRKDEAAFWFYVGQLRARYDANLCMDNSAKGAVSMLTGEYGPEINKYAIANIDSLEKTVKRVIEFVKANEENYDHRWINLHGMDAMMASMDDSAAKKELSQPKEKWAEIKKKTIDDYYSGFLEAVKKKKG